MDYVERHILWLSCSFYQWARKKGVCTCCKSAAHHSVLGTSAPGKAQIICFITVSHSQSPTSTEIFFLFLQSKKKKNHVISFITEMEHQTNAVDHSYFWGPFCIVVIFVEKCCACLSNSSYIWGSLFVLVVQLVVHGKCLLMQLHLKVVLFSPSMWE